jgi:hypothetical protein
LGGYCFGGVRDLMMNWNMLMEEDPCTMKISPLEAQRFPQIAKKVAHYARILPLEGMASSFTTFLFSKGEN